MKELLCGREMEVSPSSIKDFVADYNQAESGRAGFLLHSMFHSWTITHPLRCLKNLRTKCPRNSEFILPLSKTLSVTLSGRAVLFDKVMDKVGDKVFQTRSLVLTRILLCYSS